MAQRMETSRSQLDRLLDPEYEDVTLSTLKPATAAVGMWLELELRQFWWAGQWFSTLDRC